LEKPSGVVMLICSIRNHTAIDIPNTKSGYFT